MQENLKQQIYEAVINWIEPGNNDRSAEKLSVKSGVSTSYISHIKRGLFSIGNTQISDATFIKLAIALGIKASNELHWETKNFVFIQKVCARTQESSKIVLLDSERSGLGKTYALEYYSTYHDRVLYIKCTKSMSPKDMLNEILHKLHINEIPTGLKDKIDAIRNKVLSVENYLIIIDEAEIVKNSIYLLIKEIIDFTYRKCAVIVSGLGLNQKLKKYADKNKEGFPQLRRRLSIVCMVTSIDNLEMINLLNSEGITATSAHRWFVRNVTDYQALTEYVMDAKELAARTSRNIDGVFLKEAFGLSE